jgi:phosphate transport system substrate-binding protein
MKVSAVALVTAAALLSGCGGTSGPDAAEVIWAAGSSTVFPFATRVSENFARKTGERAPRIESLGTGGGMKAFCSSAGAGAPDIATASRRMKPGEFKTCQSNGVTEIVEIKFGYDGIVIAGDKRGPDLDFTRQDLFAGLAAQVPSDGRFVANPNRTWREVNPELPDMRIQVYGPPPTSGTRDAWTELAIVPGAESYPELKALKESDEDRFKGLSEVLRRDGGWVDSGENDNAIIQTLTRTPGALGVFGYSFLEQNADKVKPVKVGGVAPSVDAIMNDSYPLSRSLFIYVKKRNVAFKPALAAFVREFASDAASGRGGYLQDRGLIPLPADEHEAIKAAAKALTPMAPPE